MKFGETLSKLRKSKGLSQEELAEKLGLTRQTISKWELGQSTADAEYVLKLSDIFEVSTEYLLKGEEKERAINKNNNSEISSVGTKWSFGFGFGCAFSSFIGIIAFVICSALNPWTADVNGKVFKGLPGFLTATGTLWFFVILCIIFVAGTVVSALEIIKKKK